MITYRDATPADAAKLAALGTQTFSDTFGHLYSPENLALFLKNHAPEHWAEQLADPAYAVRVAEEAGALIAYCKLGPHAMPFEPRGHPIELRQLYVLQPWHGAGIAPVLMDWAVATARARGADELYLSVFTDNHRARRFYAKRGFEFVQKYAFMVGDQADEDHIMRLAL
ncbi:MAG: GNAT family N-acetyltransferase [Sphingomonas sp.]